MNDVALIERKLADIRQEMEMLDARGAELEKLARKWPAIDGAPFLYSIIALLGYKIGSRRIKKRFPISNNGGKK